MLDNFWKQIKSGSDIRGTALETSENQKVDLTNEVIEKICLSFAKWLSEKSKSDYSSLTIAVGHDSRVSAYRIKNASINAFRSVGINVYDCSLASTPAMFMATSTLACAGAVQITASHHPFDRNGFKFFTEKGGLSDSDIEEILQFAQNGVFPTAKKRGNVRAINLMNYYCEKLKEIITTGIKSKTKKPLEGFKIVVDAGNGAGGFFVNEVLTPLGADTSGSIFLEPDGNFPNHIPNPENPKAMEYISMATLKANADLGIIFDTDVDRAAVINSNGKEISKNKLIALASVIALKSNPGGIIVTDSVTSDYLKMFIEKSGGTQLRYKRGYHNVITMAKKINQDGGISPLAIESSGHAAFKENDFVDDGAFLAAKIIVEMVNLRQKGKTLDDVIKDLKDSKESVSLRIPILSNDVDEIANKILNDLKNYAKSNKGFHLETNNIEGIRINFESKHQRGWLLIRKSIHDPALVLYAESYVISGLRTMLNSIYLFVKKYKSIDITVLHKFLLKKV